MNRFENSFSMLHIAEFRTPDVVCYRLAPYTALKVPKYCQGANLVHLYLTLEAPI